MTVKLWNAETLVNLTTAGSQSQPDSTVLANGNLVVVWQDPVTGGDIVGRLYGPDGLPLSGEFSVVAASTATVKPHVAALGAGGFVVTYNQTTNGSADTRVFTSTGVLVSSGGGFFANSLNGALSGVGVQSAYAEAFQVNSDIYLAVANVNGVLGGASRVNTTLTGTQVNPDVATLSNGNLVVSWSTTNGDLRGRVYTSAGTMAAAVTDEFVINTTSYLDSSGETAKLVALQAGAFAAVWATTGSGVPGDPGHYEAHGRIFNVVSGVATAAGPDFLLSSSIGHTSDAPVVTAIDDGAGFLSVWFDGSLAVIRGQAFNALGSREGGEFTVSTAVGAQSSYVNGLSATTLADGRVAVDWVGSDTDGTGIKQVILDPRDGLINGTSGAETLYGSNFADQVTAQDGADIVYAGAGNDAVYGGGGNDVLFGQYGDDVLVGGAGQDYLAGGSGSDSFVFTSYLETPVATPDGIGDFTHGSDIIDVRGGAAGGLVALVHDGGGNTIVSFAPASGGGAPQGSVFVIGDVEGPDVLVDAGTGFYIVGSALAETLVGGAGADVLIGGGGADYLAGGAGADVFKYAGFAESPAATPDVIGDFQHGADKIDFTVGGAGTAVNLVHGTGVTYVYFAPGGTSAKGLIVAYGDVEAADVKVDSGVTVVTSGLGGGDVLTTSGNTDLLMGGAGKDTFQVGKLSDSKPTSPDVIEGFQSGVDKIDLSAVSGGAVNIIRDGAWSYVVYAPDGDTADGLIVVHGAVTPADLGAQPGAAVFVSHASIDAALHPEPTPDHTRVFLY